MGASPVRSFEKASLMRSISAVIRRFAVPVTMLRYTVSRRVALGSPHTLFAVRSEPGEDTVVSSALFVRCAPAVHPHTVRAAALIPHF